MAITAEEVLELAGEIFAVKDRYAAALDRAREGIERGEWDDFAPGGPVRQLEKEMLEVEGRFWDAVREYHHK